MSTTKAQANYIFLENSTQNADMNSWLKISIIVRSELSTMSESQTTLDSNRNFLTVSQDLLIFFVISEGVSFGTVEAKNTSVLDQTE